MSVNRLLLAYLFYVLRGTANHMAGFVYNSVYSLSCHFPCNMSIITNVLLQS